MANKYIALIAGVLTQIEALVTSSGAGDDGKLVALDNTGRLSTTVMPVGIGADTKSIVTSENLAAGDFVNIYDDSGTPTARKADASNGRQVDGFVLAGSTSPAAALVYFEGKNTQLSGLTIGALYYLSGASPGDETATPPSTSGYIVQEIGKAVSATELNFEPRQPITLA